MDKVKKRKVTDKTKENGSDDAGAMYHPRCINIDCAFNSALDITQERNICNHPNLKIKASSAEITIAICSEFRSKKDYRFKKPNTLIDLKTKDKIELEDDAEPEIVSTESLEADTTEPSKRIANETETEVITRGEIRASAQPVHSRVEEPVIIMAGGDGIGPRTPEEMSETYKLTDSKTSNFLILRRLYRPYLKRGVIFSVIFHLILIWLFYLLFVNKESRTEVPSEQRIVVVEDIETPKFIPPDMDKKPEESIDVTPPVVHPKITQKHITPNIKRPKTFHDDSTSTVHKDTVSSRILDSLIAAQHKGDTNRFMLADSLRNSFAENEIGMNLWYPKTWKLRDSRELNKGEQFSGVIINTDSLSEDPGAVTMFILLESGNTNSFNKTIFKNLFAMEDSTYNAFSTEPMQTGSKTMSYKFYIFAPMNKIYVNTDVKQEFFEKYKKYIEAVIRSIKIVKPVKNP